jgi:hypothetical protein
MAFTASLLAGAAPALPARRDVLLRLAGATLLTLPQRVTAQAGEAQPVTETLTLGGGRMELQFAPGLEAPLRAEAKAWVQRSAGAVVAYFGRFPVANVELLMVPADGAGVRGGVTYGEPSLLIRVRVGRDTTKAQFLDDWIMVHEMIHLAVPRIPRSQNWLQEGLATYVESVARGRAGLVAPATVWREWAKAMPQGQPRAGDAGLDHTPTWGRTYWGGAMFCLLAGVRSARRAGLQQGLQAVLAAGGNYGVAWSVDRILATADAGVGQTTLTDLYQRMKDSPAPAELDALWRDLGVVGNTLNDNAPLAAVRRAILS